MAAGGGVLLFISMFLTWYTVKGGTPSDQRACGATRDSCTGFDTFHLFTALIIPGMDFLMVAAAIAPWILVWIVIRGHRLSWPAGEVTMIVGATASTLILYNGIISRPGARESARISNRSRTEGCRIG